MEINSVPRRRTLVDHVVEQVRDNVESGVVKSGDRLPTELELCERFGVSRTVIREATRRLQSLGLVEVRRGRGHGLFVGGRDSVRDSVQLVRGALAVSLADLEKFNEFRAAIECQAARQAARKATPVDVEKLDQLCEALAMGIAQGESFEEVQKRDVAFHLQIAAIGGNDLIHQVLQLVRDMMLKSMARTAPGHLLNAEQSRRLHRAVVDAIRAGDQRWAEDAMREHMEAVQQRLEQNATESNGTNSINS